MDSEPVIMSANGVTVTRTRFVVGGHTYAMSGVTSVTSIRKKRNPILPLLVVIGGSILLNAAHWAVGLAVIAVGIILLFAAPRPYVVLLRTAGGEISAYTTTNREFVAIVLEALSRAIVARGSESPTASVSDDALDQLARLGILRSDKVITEEEFLAKKKQLLDLPE